MASGTGTESDVPTWLDEFCASKVWDLTQMEDLSLTGLTPCFENTVLRGAVHLTFLVLCSWRLVQLSRVRPLPESIKTDSHAVYVVKLILIGINVCTPLLFLNGLLAADPPKWAPFELVTEPLAAVVWLLALYVTVRESRRFVSSGRWIMPFLFLFHFASDLVRLRTRLELAEAQDVAYFFALFLIAFSAVGGLVLLSYFVRPSDVDIARRIRSETGHTVELEFALRSLDPDKMDVTRGAFLPGEEHDDNFAEDPKVRSSCLSRVFFSFMTPLIRLGTKRPLELEDVWQLEFPYRTFAVGSLWERVWQSELQEKKPSLNHALYKAFGREFAAAGFFLLIQNSAQYVPPVLLRSLIRFVAEEEAKPEAERDLTWGYFLGGAMALLMIFMTTCENKYFDMVIRVGVKVRAALVTAIYRKSLRMSNKARQERSAGAIANHMSTDTEKIQMQAMMLHNLWSSPLRIGIGMYLLWDGLGPSVVAGVLLLIIVTPLQVKVMKKIAMLMKKQFSIADERIKTVNEILNGMRVIKYMAWEHSFKDRVDNTRGKELMWLRKQALARGVTLLLINLNPVVLAVGTFAAFAIAEGDLSAEVAFYALSLFNLLFWPIMLLPRTVAMLIETNISTTRIGDFLMCSELSEKVKPLADDDADCPKGTVQVKDGNFSWGDDKVLHDVDFVARPGELVAVVGATGSGKSSLGSAILSEMDSASNSLVRHNGSLAYVPQQAWIFNATVRENILFGNPFDEDKYWRAVALANLEPDFGEWANEDQTEIGEKGVNLSGGQRQRVSIARAIYADSDIYIFDDPLSALDAHVGSSVFHECIQRGLEGRTRILITNQLQFMHSVDRVYVMKDGRVAESGTVDELCAIPDGELARMMQELTRAGGEEETGAAVAADGEETKDESEPTAEALGMRAKEKVEGRKQAQLEGHDDGHLIEKEEREVGGISWAVYGAYIRAAGGGKFFLTIMFLYLLGEASRILSSYWLGVWSDDTLGETIAFYMGIYFVLSVGQALMSAIVSVLGAYGSVWASKVLHERMLTSMLRAPMYFFDSTPIGRIINRFTKDMSQIDTMLMFNVSLFLSGTTRLVGTLTLVGVVSPYAIVSFVPIMLVFWFLQKWFRTTSRELKRLDSISRSPVYAHFTESLDGMTSIRAYGAQDRMTRANASKLDTNQSVHLVHMTTNRWLSIRLEILGGLMLFSAAAFALFNKQPSGLLGLSMSYALSITTQLMMMVRMSTETENSFNAVERVESYGKIPSEAEEVIEHHRPPSAWPKEGTIQLKDLRMSYRPGGPDVLKGLTINIGAHEKIGVAGRTGAGKSTLFQALFRIAEAKDGSVSFDGENIAQYGLHDVRRALSIIPQEPVLFSGTLRSNLDPFDQIADDAEIMAALDKAQLRKLCESHPLGLSMPVAENGENFSVGQRQLVCLARALLNPAKILVVDEATANVDMETDALIQKTIREHFADRTTLTIAHRLNTIIDSDRILILHHGELAEIDTPANLLANPDSHFSSMVDETGPENAAFLRRVASGEVVDYMKELDEAAERAKVLTDSHVISRGPLARRFEEAIDVCLEGIHNRHGAEWAAEHKAVGVTERLWLGRMYTLLDDLHNAAQEAMEEDDFHPDDRADEAVQSMTHADHSGGTFAS